MNKNQITLFLLLVSNFAFGQTNLYPNTSFLKNLHLDSDYNSLKSKISQEFANVKPGKWGEFVNGVDEDLITKNKIVALTFDACGGKNADGYDKDLIDFLKKEKIPATLFVTGKWIDANYLTFIELSKEPLFEIENHGLNHKPCSIDGESEFGIKGTPNIGDAIDEIEANAIKIENITHTKPIFYRSATAYTDEACAKIATALGVTMISFDVLSGDAIPNTPKNVIENNVLKTIRPGAIIIMHFNRPNWNTAEALYELIPNLQKQGYSFAKLRDYHLKGK
jgi:peptidoglycan/xylan/chitin deacetylase (PgdA/CDA1 family)